MGITQTRKLFSLLLKVLADTRTEDVKDSSSSLGFPTVRSGKGWWCFPAVSEFPSWKIFTYLLTYLLRGGHLQFQKKLLAVFSRSFPGGQKRGK